MSYMVIFRTADGKPGYVPAEGVQEAVEAVERLRNDDGADNVRIYRMEEVAFEYKVHYSVQLTDPSVADAGGSPAADDAPSFGSHSPSPSSDAPEAGDDTGAVDELSWDDEPEAAPSSPPFDQMAVDPAGTPRWDDSAEDAPITIDEPEPVSTEPDARRGLFGR